MGRSNRLLAPLVAFCVLMPSAALAGGTIEGKVVYTGTPKRNPLIRMGADPNCLTINAGKKVINEVVKLSADKEIGDVFVYLSGDVAYSGAAPSEPALIEQEGCIYHPRILGAMKGQTLRVINKDATLHNIHSLSEERNGFNVGQPKAGMEFNFELASQEVMLKIKCDVHPWMVGYVGVLGHPFHTVSAADGTFKIENVPAGTYSLAAWQQVLGENSQEIVVEEGGTTTVEFAFDPPTKKADFVPPSLPVREVRVGAAAAR